MGQTKLTAGAAAEPMPALAQESGDPSAHKLDVETCEESGDWLNKAHRTAAPSNAKIRAMTNHYRSLGEGGGAGSRNRFLCWCWACSNW